MSLHPAAMLAAAAMIASAADSPPQSFCERLAPRMNMKLVATKAKRPGPTDPEWKIDMLGGLGPALFGGTAVVTFAVRPVDESQAAEFKRLETSCSPNSKGATCKIIGPARITISTKTGDTTADVAEDQHPVVEMRNTSIYCRDA